MVELLLFRKANGLTQTDVGDYLGGVKKSFISAIERGKCSLPEDKLALLLTNDMGWDTSMLADFVNTKEWAERGGDAPARHEDKAKEVALLKAEVESLKAQLAEEKERSAKYWEMIEKLTK